MFIVLRGTTVISNCRSRVPKTRSCNPSSATLRGHRKSRIQEDSKLFAAKCFKQQVDSIKRKKELGVRCTLNVQPLISFKQCWFADNACRACGAGSTLEIKKWRGTVNTLGPGFGYFPNAKKCWIISKNDKEEIAKQVFKDTAVNVTVYKTKNAWVR